jgi:hypothetical protein
MLTSKLVIFQKNTYGRVVGYVFSIC